MCSDSFIDIDDLLFELEMSEKGSNSSFINWLHYDYEI